MLSPAPLRILMDALSPVRLHILVDALSPVRLHVLVDALSPVRLHILVDAFSPVRLHVLVDALSPARLHILVDTLSPARLHVLVDAFRADAIRLDRVHPSSDPTGRIWRSPTSKSSKTVARDKAVSGIKKPGSVRLQKTTFCQEPGDPMLSGQLKPGLPGLG